MHSLSGLEASQIPEAIMGIEHISARKLRIAVMLLLTAMVGCFLGRINGSTEQRREKCGKSSVCRREGGREGGGG